MHYFQFETSEFNEILARDLSSYVFTKSLYGIYLVYRMFDLFVNKNNEILTAE